MNPYKVWEIAASVIFQKSTRRYFLKKARQTQKLNVAAENQGCSWSEPFGAYAYSGWALDS